MKQQNNPDIQAFIKKLKKHHVNIFPYTLNCPEKELILHSIPYTISIDFIVLL